MSDSSRRVLNMLLALVISIGAWAYVVYNYDPMTDVKYRDVPIRFIGEDGLAARGYGIVESNRDTLDVVLNQKRTSTGAISADDITVIADVSSSVEGDNGISLEITGPEGTQVLETSAKTVSVSVEEADTKTVDVSVEYEGADDQNFEPIISSMSASSVTVVGASSEVTSVKRVIANLRASELTGNDRSFSRALYAVDKDGEIIPHMIMYPGEVTFNARSGVKKIVPLKVNIMGQDANDYEREYTAPSNIVIKGDEDSLAKVSEIETKTVNISTVYETTDFNLDYNLPDGIYIADESLDQKLHVTAKKIEKNQDEEEENSDS